MSEEGRPVREGDAATCRSLGDPGVPGNEREHARDGATVRTGFLGRLRRRLLRARATASGLAPVSIAAALEAMQRAEGVGPQVDARFVELLGAHVAAAPRRCPSYPPAEVGLVADPSNGAREVVCRESREGSRDRW